MKDMTWKEIIEFIQKNYYLDEVASVSHFVCGEYVGELCFDIEEMDFGKELVVKDE